MTADTSWARPLRTGLALRLALGLLLLLTGCPQGGAGGSDAGGSTAGTASRTSKTGQTAPAPIDPAAGRALQLWADPVLVPALNGLAKAYHSAVGGSYSVTPIERGALLAWAKEGDNLQRPIPDVLLFAGQGSHDALLIGKRIDEATARTFAGDRLVVLKALGSTFVSPSVGELWEQHFHHIALADPQTTALGLYTQQALVGDGAEKRLKDRTQTYQDSTQLPGLPAQDPSTLSIAFSSQSGSTKGVEPLLLVDKSLHESVQYRAVAVTGQGSDPAVLAFLRWLAEDDKTQTALGGYGLLSRSAALGLEAPVGAPLIPPASVPQKAPPAETSGGK